MMTVIMLVVCKQLINELEKKHDVYVAAPATNHSAGSSALSVRKNIKVDNIQKNHYVIDGTPADRCILHFRAY